MAANGSRLARILEEGPHESLDGDPFPAVPGRECLPVLGWALPILPAVRNHPPQWEHLCVDRGIDPGEPDANPSHRSGRVRDRPRDVRPLATGPSEPPPRINRARKAGLQLRCSTSEQDCRIHCQLMAESMRRRETTGRGGLDQHLRRGIPGAAPATGAGVLFQAVLDGRVLSSALVLLSGRGAYDHTSGTCPEGMEHGASHFLIFETARNLQERGTRRVQSGRRLRGQPGVARVQGRFRQCPALPCRRGV